MTQKPHESVLNGGIAIIATQTCENNLYHFLHETLHPISAAAQKYRDKSVTLLLVSLVFRQLISGNLSLPYHGGGNDGHGHVNWDCHGARYHSMLSSIPNLRAIFLVDHETDDCEHPEQFSGHPTNWTLKTAPYWMGVPNHGIGTWLCFDRCVVAQPAVSSSVVPNILHWAGCNKSTRRRRDKPYVFIIQRREGRRFANADDATAMLLTHRGLDGVGVHELEYWSIKEQINNMACRNLIIIGVTGAGLQWTQFCGHLGFKCFVVEVGYPGWNTKPYHIPRASGTRQGQFILGTPISPIVCKCPWYQTHELRAGAMNCADCEPGKMKHHSVHLPMQQLNETMRRASSWFSEYGGS